MTPKRPEKKVLNNKRHPINNAFDEGFNLSCTLWEAREKWVVEKILAIFKSKMSKPVRDQEGRISTVAFIDNYEIDNLIKEIQE